MVVAPMTATATATAVAVAPPKPPPRFVGRPKPKGPPPRVRDPAPIDPPPPDRIEPNRQRRIVRERESLDRRLDLHGLDQDGAKAALFRFLRRAHDDGYRAVLVITGKGLSGDGVLRRRVPEWLAEAPLRGIVAGVSIADRRHGGEGALYVALRRRA